MIAPTIACAVAFESVADRNELTAGQRYRLAELAACAAERAGHELVTTGDLDYAVKRLDSLRGHVCELDPWQRDPLDPDYLEPADRWCRVCLKHPDHPIHNVTPRSLAAA